MSDWKMKMKTDKFFRTFMIIGIVLIVLDLLCVGYFILQGLTINGAPVIKKSILDIATAGKILFAINFIGVAIPAFAYIYKRKFGKVQDDDKTKSH